MNILNLYKNCIISFTQGLDVVKSVNMGQVQGDLEFWQQMHEISERAHGLSEYTALIQDLQESTYDWEGYRSRLYLASEINKDIFNNKYSKNIIFNFVNGKVRSEVESDLRSGKKAFQVIMSGASGYPTQFKKWWNFCSHYNCPIKGHCMLTVMEDLLPILEIPFHYPNTISGDTLSSVFNSEFNYEFIKFLANNFNTKPFGWTSVYDNKNNIDDSYKHMNLEVTSQIIAYLSLSRQLQEFSDIINISIEEIFNQWIYWLNKEKVTASDTDRESGLNNGLWNGWMVSSDRKLTQDKSLSVTIHIAKSLVSTYSSLPDDLKESTVDNLLKDIIKYCLDKLDGKDFIAQTYGHDYYYNLSPISDVRGCIQICDLILELINTDYFYPQLSKFGLISPYDERVMYLINRIINHQMPNGWWPLLSKDFIGKRLNNVSSCFSKEEIKKFKIFTDSNINLNDSYNISFDNTAKALLILYKYISLISIRKCKRCDVQTFAFYCPECGRNLFQKCD